jgi:hypothetical protein
MNAKPHPAADDDGTSDGTAEPVILGPAEYIAKSINGEIDPAEWDDI